MQPASPKNAARTGGRCSANQAVNNGLLAPHADELAVVGSGVDCGGAVDSLLAGLAWRLGQLDEAAERARAGLALETRVGSGIWITRTGKLIAQIESTARHGK